MTTDSYGYINYGDPQTLNLYAYCGNNPINFVDPNGNELVEVIGGAIIKKLITDLIVSVALTYFAQKAVNDAKAKEKKEKVPDSPGSMQKEVEKGQAPAEVDRVDKPHVPGQKPHVHFRDGTSLNNDGTVHDAHKGTPKPSNKTSKWLKDHGWKVGN